MPEVIVNARPADVISIIQSPSDVLNIAGVGTQGPKGDPGGAHMHTQATPSAVWTIQHNLGYKPGGISVRDSLGDPVEEATRTYASINVTLLTFLAPLAGVAYIS